MIPVANSRRQSETWQQTLREAIRSSSTLLERLGLADHPLARQLDDGAHFNTLVPVPFLRRMRRHDPDDPLLLQVLATRQERDSIPGFSTDPLTEANYLRAPGLLQKYAGRALLIAATTCAVNCRYCFRRHFPYTEHQGAQVLPDPVLNALAADSSIHEVILSGGDPLMLRDNALRTLVERLGEIAHLTTLRIHTRLPVVIPERVTDGLVDILATTRLRSVVVLHINHPAEIDDELGAALTRLRSSGAILLNQSVLLRRVNDHADILVELSERLIEYGVLPYYLHLLDPVAGAAHFNVSRTEAFEFVKEVRARLPGYLVPRLVHEIPGATSKTEVTG